MKSEKEQQDALAQCFADAQMEERTGFGTTLINFLFSGAIWPRFRMAPASSAHSKHHAYEGGLLDHCIDVAQLAIKADPDKVAPRSSIVAVAFLHDLHKIGNAAGDLYYVPNLLKSGKRSDAKPFESNDACVKFASVSPPDNISHLYPSRQLHYLLSQTDTWPDGELSLSLVYTYNMVLYDMIHPSERFAIIHHAGMYDRVVRNSLIGNETYLMMLMHFADMLSSRRRSWFGAVKEA